MSPGDASNLANLAEAPLGLGRTVEAIALAEQALALDAESDTARKVLAAARR